MSVGQGQESKYNMTGVNKAMMNAAILYDKSLREKIGRSDPVATRQRKRLAGRKGGWDQARSATNQKGMN